jgi:hypothetical protein
MPSKRYINLEDCHLEICYGLAHSSVHTSARVIPHLEMQNNFLELTEFKLNEGPRIQNVAESHSSILTEEENQYYNKLNIEQKKRFLRFYKNAYCDGEFVQIKFPQREFAQKPFATFTEADCEWHQNAKYFEKTLQFVSTLPFLEIGRILFFVSYHHLPSDVHYDRQDNVFDGKNHFLWLNPFQQKKFFLIDDEKNKKYVDSSCAFFNTRYLHGAEASPKTTYSMRIDGQFTEEFCKKAGILWTAR